MPSTSWWTWIPPTLAFLNGPRPVRMALVINRVVRNVSRKAATMQATAARRPVGSRTSSRSMPPPAPPRTRGSWCDAEVTSTTPMAGSVALITGGTGGFGRALAAKLRERDVTVVLADLDSDRNRKVAADLGCPFVVLDVTDRAANEAVVAQVEAEHGRLDAAYLNAGISAAKSDDELDMAEFM